MLRLRCVMLSPAIFAMAAMACAQSPANCKINYISQPGNKYGLAPEGINQYNTIVGYSNQNAPTNFIRYNDGTFGKITVAGAGYTVAMRRNASGTTVGYWVPSGLKYMFSNYQGFVNSNGATSILKYPGAQSTMPSGINKYGTIVGSFTPGNAGLAESFEYKNGTWTRVGQLDRLFISSINDSGTMAGSWDTKDGDYGVIYASPTATPQELIYPGSDDTWFYDINDAGWVVGAQNTAPVVGGLIYNSKTDTFYSLNAPNALDTYLTGINSANIVVGYARFPNPSGEGYYTRGFYAPCTF